MADKISTIVLEVDLECERCYKKIRRVLCKIQDKQNIKTISFDEKSNAVTISGPFDADKVCKKLCSKAGRVIKAMDIKGGEKVSKGKDGDGDKAKAGKPAEKDAGKAEKKAKDGKAEKKDKEGKGEEEGKPDKQEKGNKKPDVKKVKFDLEDADAGAPEEKAKGGNKAMAMPPGMSKADLAPLLEKMLAAKAGPEAPRGEPIVPPMMPAAPAAQGVAVPSIWPAPSGSLSGYSYNPAYDYGGYGSAAPAGGYYGVPAAYDSQGWYYGGRQPYYHHHHHPHQQQQQGWEDPSAGCRVM